MWKKMHRWYKLWWQTTPKPFTMAKAHSQAGPAVWNLLSSQKFREIT